MGKVSNSNKGLAGEEEKGMEYTVRNLLESNKFQGITLIGGGILV